MRRPDERPRPSSETVAAGLARAVLIGVALGAAGRATKYSPDAIRWTLTLGVPWLVIAFGAGALTRSRNAGAVHGALVMVVSVAVYYYLGAVVERRYGPFYSAAMAIGWGSLGAAAGALFGAAGAAWRAGPGWARVGAVALVCGALAGEGIVYLREDYGPVAEAVMSAELVAAGTLALLLSRGRGQAAVTLATTVVVAMVAMVIETAVRVAMGAGGWGGA